MSSLRILVLEDHPFQLQVAAQQLRALGHPQPICAVDGNSALASLARHGSVDIALCDIQKPGMDGLSFLCKAAEIGAIRAVALLGELAPDLRHSVWQLAELLGVQVLGDLGKPLALDGLRRMLGRYEARHVPTPAVPAAGIPSLNEAKRGLAEDQFVPYYQPKVDLHTLSPVGAEVLVRWRHPGLGLLAPSSFLPLIERGGEMPALTYRLLDSVLTFVQSQEPTRRLPLAINFNPRLLDDPDLPSHLKQRLDYFGLPASTLNIEITENGLAEAPATGLENLLKLRLMGCSVSIDDFGTGTSSLQRFCQIPCNEIKLDASFVQSMDHNLRSKAVLSSTLMLARSLNLNVVAEGIENESQLHYLRALGYPQGQGYLFGRPMPANDFVRWLQEQNGPTQSLEG
ncbi:EAL domain-containing response regulator [Metapseudomonas boanensis]|uniref:EAL domain-containing response regulator n=1 Tax=Metapseudomonas boanensis TaxID=2822138 RepID=A0ABS5XBR5_9GAMM|nr:EAL domain-containing response regulator [Pseudomonas boanensis]MBT8765136.1 EAL domain-containing response regulator [Pseudomonas boanensis]